MNHTITKNSGLLLALLGIVALGGCTGPQPFAAWDDHALAHRVAEISRGHSAHIPGQIPGAAIAPRLPRPEDAIPDDAGVSWYVEQALRSNPQVRAARQRVERLRERVPQVTALPDPTASITFGELAQTAAGQVDYIVGVRQSLPFPGTLDARGEVARQEVVESLFALEDTINQIVADTRRAYWSYDGAGREADVLREGQALLEQIEAAVQSRIRVGRADQSDALRVSRERAALDNRLSELEQRQRTAAAMLARLTSRSAPPGARKWPNAANEDWETLTLDAERLRTWAQSHHPEVAAAQARIGTFRQRLDLARRERLPDFVAGVQYGAVGDGLAPSSNGDDQFAVTLGITIPLWVEADDAAEREALRGIGETVAEARAAQDQAAFAVDDALARLEADQQVLRRLRERMMPDAKQVIELALTNYRTGDTDFLQLLDDWQTLLDDQRQEARVVAGLHRTMADLEQALGGSMPSPPEVPEEQANPDEGARP
jgi:outer membrane protein TolC